MAGPNIGDVVLGIRLDDAALFAGLEASRRRVEGAAPVRIPAPVLPNVAQGAASQALAIQAPPPGLFARINADLDALPGKFATVRTAWSEFTGSISRTAALFAGIGVGALAVDLAKTGKESERSKLQINALTSAYGETEQATGAVARVQAVLGTSAIQARGDFAQLYAGLRAGGISAGQLEILLVGTQKAARLSGASASEASAGFLQLKQGLASGRLAGDELRSVLENMPILAQAIAKQIGVPVGALRDLGAEGKITTDIIFKAVADLAGRDVPQFTAADQIGIALTNVKEKVAEALGPVAIQFATGLGAALITLGRYIEDNREQIAGFAQGVLNIAGQLAPFAGTILTVVGAFQAWSLAAKAAAVAQAAVLALSGPGGLAALAAGLGLAEVAYLAITTASKGAQTAITQTTAKVKAEVGKQQAAFAKLLGGTAGPPPTPESAKDFADGDKKAAKEAEKKARLIEAAAVARIRERKEAEALGKSLDQVGGIAGVSPQTIGQVQSIVATWEFGGKKVAETLVKGASDAANKLIQANDKLRQAELGAFDLLNKQAQSKIKQSEINRIRANTPSDADFAAINAKAGALIVGPGSETLFAQEDALLNANIEGLKSTSDNLFNLKNAQLGAVEATKDLSARLRELITAYESGASVFVTVPQGSAVGGDAQTAVRYN